MSQKVTVKWDDRAARTKAEIAKVQASKAGGEFLLEAANRTVPRDEGDLAASGKVDASHEGAAVLYDAPYAVRQHEDQEARHQGAGRAKWLERASEEEKGKVGLVMAKEATKVFS